MYERFTDRARKVMQLANQEATRFNHEYIGTEHILLGIIAEGSSVAANVLNNLGVDLDRVRREVEAVVLPGSETRAWKGPLPQTPRFKRAIEFAIAEAKQMQHNYVGTEHMFLGLIREGEGVGAQVLMNLGLSPTVIREEILQLLGFTDVRPAGTQEPSRSAELPPRIAKAVQMLRDVFDILVELRDEAVAVQDFDRAVAFRDQRSKVQEVWEYLLGQGHSAPMAGQDAVADLTVTSATSATASTAADDRLSNRIEIHLPLSSQAGELPNSTVLNTFLRQLSERFGRIYCWRVPFAGLYDHGGTAQHGEAIHWWFFADDKPAAIAFLREFRGELQKALGLDKIVMLCHKVTII